MPGASRGVSRGFGRGRALAWVTASMAVLTSLTLVACAPEVAAGWRPAAPPGIAGVALIDPGIGDLAPPTDASQANDGNGDGGGDSGSDSSGAGGDGGDGTADPPPAAQPIDAAALGLVGGRLRNDALPLAARFVYVPGVPEFNTRVNALLWEAITASGVGYAPQAHAIEAGLSDRGCLTGSTSWPAADVLARAETGPVGGSGTAIVCDVTAAFATTVSVTLRTVTGGPDGVTSDHTQQLIANLDTGQVVEGVQRWSDAAPGELWQRTIELLRVRAGGLSSAPIGEPNEEQRGLAAAALNDAVQQPDGGVLVTFPAGLASPELAGLGIEVTTEPTVIAVDSEVAAAWANDAWRAMVDQADQPFAGIAAAATSVAIDCALIPCVALTYDDGPTGLTPQLLDTLAAEQASATFYMLGGAAAANPETVVRAAAEGHELGSHTMRHPDLTTLSLAAAAAEVNDAAALLRQISGAPVTTFRPPYGEVNGAIIAAVGMPAILWTVDTNDWRVPGVAALFERAVLGANPGGIVLFHDTHGDSVAVAGDVVRGLRDRGFEPVTVTELFGGSVPQGRVSGR